MRLKMSAVRMRVLLGGAGCIGVGAVALVALPMCANEPLPPCHVEISEAVAAYTPMGPPSGTGCENWVPPTLQGLGTYSDTPAMMGTPPVPQSNVGCGPSGCPAASGSTVVGEAFGLESYVPDQNDPNAPDIPGSMAIKLEYVGVRIQDYLLNYLPSLDGGGGSGGDLLPNYPYTSSNPPPSSPPPGTVSSNNPYAWGKFDTVRPVNGVCKVSNMTGSKLVYPDVPEHTATNGIGTTNLSGTVIPPGFNPSITVYDQPQTSIDYEWSNVRVVADDATGSVGGQVFADLTITQDACSQSFHVAMMAPRVTCNGANGGGDITQCKAAGGNSTPDRYPIIGDASLQSQAYGSGLYPGVPVGCSNIYPTDGGAVPTTDFECLPTRTGPQQ